MSGDYRIRSFKPFAGALILASEQSRHTFPDPLLSQLMGHPANPDPNHINGHGCCLLHFAATLPGGEEARWLAEYAHGYNIDQRNSRPEIGIDPRVDCWEVFESRDQSIFRLVSSANAGNIYALNWVRRLPLWSPAFNDVLTKWRKVFESMPLDQLESFAERGSVEATKILRHRLHASRLVDDARYTFWDFVFCVVHGQVFWTNWSRPGMMSQVARFQLGACLKAAYDSHFFDMRNLSECMFYGKDPSLSEINMGPTVVVDQYLDAEKRARKAIDTWCWAAQRQGVIYDARRIIVKLLWDVRWTWIQDPPAILDEKGMKAFYTGQIKF